MLWKEKWGDVSLQETWPHLFSFAKNEFISLKQALAAPDLTELFNMHVSEESMAQLNLFQALLEELLPGNGFDCWKICGNAQSSLGI
jgi:hypothetical protein